MAFSGNINREIQLIIDVIDYKMFKGKYLVGMLWPGFHYTTNSTTTTQKQSDYKVEQSSFTLIALF